MTQATTLDFGPLARDLNLPPDKVQRTVALLDEGNTVPFITRYRKDHTGGLDEEQIREIQSRVGKARQLAERKATILKTIETQGKLTPELAEQILHANTPKRLEDLYLPFKPKKQTLATIARERGLEPLAIEIYEEHPAAADLQARAATFIAPDKELNTVDDVLAGVGHLIAERFSEKAELRGRLRRIFQRTGQIVCTKVEQPQAEAAQLAAPMQHEGERGTGGEGETEGQRDRGTEGGQEVGVGSRESGVASQEAGIEPATSNEAPSVAPLADPEPVLSTEYSVPSTESAVEKVPRQDPSGVATDERSLEFVQNEALRTPPSLHFPAPGPENHSPPLPLSSSPPLDNPPEAEMAATATTEAAASGESLRTGRLFEPPATPVAAPLAAAELKKKKKKKKKRVIGEHAFKDYYNFREALGRVPPHRVLAINRGEKAHAIRVKLEADQDAMLREAEDFLIGPNHPHGEFLRGCVRDALSRLILPSLEREIRREMTERAEEHAVEVFVRNLRKLLLQPPTRGRRVLAIDPGFKSGSKMAALDEFGNVLGHGMVFVIGKDDERRKKARARLAEMVRQHNVSVIAIGNGTGCRETEQLVADCLAGELKDRDVAYVIVNEAGASIYSTSPLGREELPQYDALQRGAISIGRRLLDPLSEMVKIHPANLGVGLYQHDIKAKHLKDSLDAVVESCVNFVGVDVNSASPALLKYVSGMNALTARRVYEHRREHGPFKNREELKKVPGFGEQSFVQAAGFLKVIGGENPLDATWIHPESYDIARRVLEKIGCDVSELAKLVPAPVKKEERKEFGVDLRKLQEGERGREGEGETEGQSDGAKEEGQRFEVGGQGSEVGGQGSEVGSQESGVRNQESSTDAAGAEVLSTQYSVLSTEASAEVQIQSVSSTAVTASPSDSSHSLSVSPSLHSEPLPPQTTGRNLIAERAASVDVDQLAAELNVGTHLLRDILTSLTRPALDPRDSLPPPVFRRGIMKLEDLAPAMELSGTVLNVVDFGVFVDIGLSDSGLVHISRLADRFVRDPHEVVGVGDVLKVWVVDVDKTRRRVSLTAIPPGTERRDRAPREKQRSQPPRQRRPARQEGVPPAEAPRAQDGGAPPAAAAAVSQRQGPPRPHGGARRDQRRGGRQPYQHPKRSSAPPPSPSRSSRSPRRWRKAASRSAHSRTWRSFLTKRSRNPRVRSHRRWRARLTVNVGNLKRDWSAHDVLTPSAACCYS